MAKRKEKKVSIIMLTWNNLPFTQECLEALEKTTDGYELVVVDNGSTDGTPDYLKNLEKKKKDVKVILNQTNRGFAAGCNQGVRAARHNLICLLHNDIVPQPGWLEAVKEAFTKEVGIVGARLVYPDRTLEHCGIVFEYRTEPQPHFLPRHRYQGYPIEILEANRLEAVPAVTGACLLTSKMIWDDVAGMDEGYVIANFEDVDFNLKVRERGYKVVYQPEATLIHHTAVTLRLLSPQEKEHYMQQNFQRLMTKWYEKLAAGMVMP